MLAVSESAVSGPGGSTRGSARANSTGHGAGARLHGEIRADRPLLVVALEIEALSLHVHRLPILVTGLGKVNAAASLAVTLALDRPRDVNILPGMTATVYARPDIVADESLRIPVAAVLRSESGQAAVWVVDPDSSRIEQRVVRLREEDGSGTAMVLDGLQAGERIVGAGASQLRAGVEIRPYRAGMLSE